MILLVLYGIKILYRIKVQYIRYIMPALEFSLFHYIQDDYRVYPYFLETGTYLCHTIFAMEPHFQRLYTVELKEEFYENAKKKYGGDKIEFYLGDSAIVLPEILPTIPGDTIMFLDGHYSCANTAQGPKDCPLYEELTAIRDKFKHRAILIIDDCRLFGLGPKTGFGCDWEEINESGLLDALKPRIAKWYYLPSYLHEKDRMIVHLSAMIPEEETA